MECRGLHHQRSFSSSSRAPGSRRLPLPAVEAPRLRRCPPGAPTSCAAAAAREEQQRGRSGMPNSSSRRSTLARAASSRASSASPERGPPARGHSALTNGGGMANTGSSHPSVTASAAFAIAAPMSVHAPTTSQLLSGVQTLLLATPSQLLEARMHMEALLNLASDPPTTATVSPPTASETPTAQPSAHAASSSSSSITAMPLSSADGSVSESDDAAAAPTQLQTTLVAAQPTAEHIAVLQQQQPLLHLQRESEQSQGLRARAGALAAAHTRIAELEQRERELLGVVEAQRGELEAFSAAALEFEARAEELEVRMEEVHEWIAYAEVGRQEAEHRAALAEERAAQATGQLRAQADSTSELRAQLCSVEARAQDAVARMAQELDEAHSRHSQRVKCLQRELRAAEQRRLQQDQLVAQLKHHLVLMTQQQQQHQQLSNGGEGEGAAVGAVPALVLALAAEQQQGLQGAILPVLSLEEGAGEEEEEEEDTVPQMWLSSLETETDSDDGTCMATADSCE